MNKFYFILIVMCLISCNEEPSKSPNFIFILSDDQGWNGTSNKMMDSQDYSKSDYYETPNIENLAKS